MNEERGGEHYGAANLLAGAWGTGAATRAGEVEWDLAGFTRRQHATVTFPAERSLGKLFLMSPSAIRPGEWLETSIGPAQGEVKVPRGKRLRLVMSERAARSLKPLAKLGARDLHSLDLGFQNVTDGQLRHLRGLTWLSELNLRCNIHVAGYGLAHLCGMQLLERLDLWGCDITDEGFLHLPRLPMLRELNLTFKIFMTEDALSNLAKLPALEILHLEGTMTSDRSLALLAGMKGLRSLDLTGTCVSRTGYELLRAALPRCRITWSMSIDLQCRMRGNP